MPRFILLAAAAALSLTALPAFAQDGNDAATQERIDRLEHDIQLMQRQVARGDTSAAPVSNSAPISDADVAAANNPAQLEVRLANMEDELRQMRGKIEEDQFQIKKISDNFDKMQKDIDFRFSELTQKPAMAVTTTPAESQDMVKKSDAATDDNGPTTAGDGVLHSPDEKPQTDFSTPRELYNYGFHLLNQTKYAEAAKAFDSFTKKYAKDPLIGNAYYWEGETYYIRRDYVTAADNFRQGFEAMPEGPKAADNLLKLAMSLDALNRDKEACVVLGQITTKFKKSSASITDKAAAEQKRIGCQ